MSRRRMMSGGSKQEYVCTFDGLESARLFVNDYSNQVATVSNGVASWKAKPYTQPVQFLFSGDGSTRWKAENMDSGIVPMTFGYGQTAMQELVCLLYESESVSRIPYEITIGNGRKTWTRTYTGLKSYTVNLNINPVQIIECKYTDSKIMYIPNYTGLYKPRLISITPSTATYNYGNNGYSLFLTSYPSVRQVIINSDSYILEWRTIINKV